MLALNIVNVSLSLAARPILSGLSLEIHDDRVIGLIGPNGAGKSTLLKLIAGEHTPDAGTLTRAKGVTIGYLAQEPLLDPDKTALEEALSALPELAQIEAELARIEDRLSDPAVYGAEKKLAHALDRQAQLHERFDALGGPIFEQRVRQTLFGLGFDEADLHVRAAALSGGQRKLVGLTRLLLAQPSLLLLDEPDNHLDLDGKAFLEQFIRDYAGAVIIVSHDRYLLDRMVDEIADLEAGRIQVYPGTYSEYAFEKERRLARQQQVYSIQQREIDRLEAAAQRLLVWGRTYDNEALIKRGKNILTRIEKLDKIDRPVLNRKRIGLELNGWRGSNKVLEISALAKSFDGVPVLREVNLLVRHGERVALVGPNGAGKSLLLRMILEQETPDAGAIVIGPSVQIGYYAQHHETLDFAQSLIETVRRVKPMSENAAVAFLLKFLYAYKQMHQAVGDLSGGERSRLQLALLMLGGANFLLLDEPTNNLDIASAEVLEAALDDFEGAVLTISHDRYFLERIAGRVVELKAGAITEHLGSYREYLAKR
ncbi:MAG TPA: ABC-F family ATP-binding cassette domain-containing protein [Anaerolineae bacterium]|nr:ABC-F family ATP-binding cassette domain-containing protein [Anaerolineae bacterium]